ncbi:MAG: phosphotransferase family protein [Comamonadaceae bacterium]|nr:MAG: phosphotransferase family protein [Comamonadaceae bacterium]
MTARMLPSPFKPPQDTPPQDWAALRAHLAGAAFVLDLDQPPRQFAGGMGNLNYLIRLDDRDWVLRRPPPGDIPPGANDMAREYLILSKLYRAYPPAPRAIHFCGDASVLGAPFLVMEYRPGLVIGGELPPEPAITPQQRQRLGLQLVEQLADLHAVDADAVGLGALGRPAGMLERMVEGWNRRAVLACSSTGRDTPAGIARVHGWLRAHLLPDGAPTLLHSDFKLDNVILDPLTLAPRTVIDWDMGTRGDPLVDLATLLSYWTEPGDPQPMQALGQMPSAEPGFPSRDDVLQAYAARTGADLSGFRFHRVLAMFKLAVVFMQLHARYLRGEVSDPRFPRLGTLAAGLLECTEALATGELH